ncbi:MAG TPA: type VI secretion system protein TssA [Noviherbaspirillum sp.]
MDQGLLDQLIAPIPGDHPCGEDVSFSQAFDDVREARRQDDPSLTQGDWETELKTAQWPRVKQLCEEILRNRSKDLQIACWYTEALCHLHGFRGLHFGLQVLEVLLTDFWEFFYPDLVPDDLEERAGKIEWLNRQLPMTVRHIPLTDKASGAYSWLKWDESRTIDNLGLKDAEAKERAVTDGKLTGEMFDRAASASGLAFYQGLHQEIVLAKEKLAVVEQHVDERFGNDSPGLKDLRLAVRDCDDVVARIIARLGGTPEAAKPATPDTKFNLAVPPSTAQSTAHAVSVGEIRTRTDAIAALRQVARFFRENEPHSPVALLSERAAKWAEMPLERWLAAVIKDDSTLGQLRELLDIPREN